MSLMVQEGISTLQRITVVYALTLKEHHNNNQPNSLQEDSLTHLIHSKYTYLNFYRKEATAFKYISDGTGRDQYILVNSGGLQAGTHYGNKHLFANILRYNIYGFTVIETILRSLGKRISPKEI